MSRADNDKYSDSCSKFIYVGIPVLAGIQLLAAVFAGCALSKGQKWRCLAPLLLFWPWFAYMAAIMFTALAFAIMIAIPLGLAMLITYPCRNAAGSCRRGVGEYCNPLLPVMFAGPMVIAPVIFAMGGDVRDAFRR